MQIGIIGLGRMGFNMAARLVEKGHDVAVYNRSPQKVQEMVELGATGAGSLDELVAGLSSPRVVWMMLPSGSVVDDHIDILTPHLLRGDILVDGGNSFYKDDIRRNLHLEKHGISYMDAGVSGGIWGRKLGYCIMAGGDRTAFNHIEPLLKSLCVEGGYLYCGSTGSGHFVKMIHNGIEYALMQAYSEGFHLMKSSPYAQELRLEQIGELWNNGSVVRSWLLELLTDALKKNPELEGIKGFVEDSGEGRWTVQQAVESGVAAPVIALSLFQRFSSQTEDAFANRMLAVMRKGFGGHSIKSG